MRALLLGLLLPALAAPAAAEHMRVRSGGSIAQALELATPGSVIEVEPGLYHEALVVDTPNLTLRGIVRGSERPVLDGRGVLNDGVIASGSPFTMTGFALRHYKGNGVSTQGVDGVFLSDLIVDDTGLYGVYPVQSKNVTITHCTVTRIRDAAIYVGESQGALVAMNEVHHNVAGIEIENTNDAEVRDNLAHDNTAGILVFVLPGKVLKEGRRTRVHRNWVLRNNTPNFGDPEAIVGSLPHGIGILLMGADDTVVEHNQVRENVSLGVAITRLAEEHAKKDPPLEPMTDAARVVANHLDANGNAPHPSIQKSYGAGGDFGWDGTGRGNCADLADGARPVGAPIPGCLDAASAPVAGARAATHVPHAEAAGSTPPPALPPPDLSGAAAVVHIRAMRFEPRHVTVKPGESVVWVNDDNVVHTVTSGSGTLPSHEPLSSPFLARGQVYRHTFERNGHFEYLCLPHLDQAAMRGATVTVTQ
jgi:parallel beta-helix repeat protein